jgi:hypothetical protein
MGKTNLAITNPRNGGEIIGSVKSLTAPQWRILLVRKEDSEHN